VTCFLLNKHTNFLFRASGFQELQRLSPKQLSHLMVKLCMSVLLMEL